jgi:phospholipid transport system substrate-binding protein
MQEIMTMFAKSKYLKLFSSLLLLFLFIPGLVGFAAVADSPLALVQSGVDRALQIIKETRREQGPTLENRKAEILTIVDEYFSFTEMAKRSLGREWRNQSPEKQQEFVSLFKQLIFNTYVSRVDSYATTTGRVVYDEESIDGNYAVVRTRLQGYRNREVFVEYRLRKEKEGWRAYDVLVEGVSLIDNYRSQFTSILARESFDSLLNRLREKV